MKNADTGTFDSVFRQKAPARDLKLLGIGENITLVELCVFLPNWLKHGDVSKRFWLDGLDRNHIVNIMNWHCSLARTEGVTQNLITNWMNKSMRQLTGNKKWTHKSYAAGLDRSDWSQTNLTLAGCQLNIEHEQKRKDQGARSVIERVPFGSLGDHVETFPQGVDGLDLTRFVQYAREHPQEELWFPQDFGYLAKMLGTVHVEQGHLGAEIAKRWVAPLAKDQKSQAAQLADHTGTLQTMVFGESVARSSHRYEGEISRKGKSFLSCLKGIQTDFCVETLVSAAHPPQSEAYLQSEVYPQGEVYPSQDVAYPSSNAAVPSYDAAGFSYDVERLSHDAAYSFQDARYHVDDAEYHFDDAVNPFEDTADTPYVLTPSASQQLVPEISRAAYNPQASYWEDISTEDFSIGLEDELSLLLHQDLLNNRQEHKQITEPGLDDNSLPAAGVLDLGPCLDDEALDILYNRYQHMLYMAVPEHIDPMILVKDIQW